MQLLAKSVGVSEFRAKCPRILDEVEPQGIVVTKRGKPIAKVTPINPVDNSKFFGCMKGKIVIKGDIFSTGVKWNAQSL
jgi:prevent-host-death family protein